MGDREHGAKGLCQERAFVSGLEAANALSRSGALSRTEDGSVRREKQANVIPIRDDEFQYTVAKDVNKRVIDFLGENNLFNYVLGIRK
jgi:hypothetical protein